MTLVEAKPDSNVFEHAPTDFLNLLDIVWNLWKNDLNHSCFWFRGQPNTDNMLIPRVHRDGQYLLADEREMTNRFRAEAYVRHSQCPDPAQRGRWLMLMTHYGGPTRLLDWTRNPLFALHFALNSHAQGSTVDEEADTTDAALWCMAPAILTTTHCKPLLDVLSFKFSSRATANRECGRFGENDEIVPSLDDEIVAKFLEPAFQPLSKTEKEQMRDKETEHQAHARRFENEVMKHSGKKLAGIRDVKVIPVVGEHIDLRMASQQARFTLHSDNTDLASLENLRGRGLWKIIIPRTCKETYRHYLALLGVRGSTLFPDLSGVARQLSIDYARQNRTKTA